MGTHGNTNSWGFGPTGTSSLGAGASGAHGGTGHHHGLGGSSISDDAQKHQQFLGDASSALPNLGELCLSAGLGVSVATSVAGAAAFANISSSTGGSNFLS